MTVTMMTYETFMDLMRKRDGLTKFKQNENRYVIQAAMLGGLLSGLLMNSFECIVYLRIAE